MGFVRESSKKHANPFESSANPPANPLDFSPQELRFLVRPGPTLMRILSEYLRILWSSPHSNLVFWYKPEAPERRLSLASNANCMYDCGCIVFCVFLALSQSDLGYIRLFGYTEAIFITCEGGHTSCQAPKHEAYQETPCTSRAHRSPC